MERAGTKLMGRRAVRADYGPDAELRLRRNVGRPPCGRVAHAHAQNRNKSERHRASTVRRGWMYSRTTTKMR